MGLEAIDDDVACVEEKSEADVELDIELDENEDAGGVAEIGGNVGNGLAAVGCEGVEEEDGLAPFGRGGATAFEESDAGTGEGIFERDRVEAEIGGGTGADAVCLPHA